MLPWSHFFTSLEVVKLLWPMFFFKFSTLQCSRFSQKNNTTEKIRVYYLFRFREKKRLKCSICKSGLKKLLTAKETVNILKVRFYSKGKFIRNANIF